MLSITKTVSKRVAHPTMIKDGKPVMVKREAKITQNFVDPKSPNMLEDALVICGGNSELLGKVINQGLWRPTQQWETNALGKVDEVSKGVQAAIDGLTKAGLTAEQARATIMSNTVLVERLGAQKFEQFVDVTVSDFENYATKEVDGHKVSRYPDVTDISEDEAEVEEVEVAPK